MGTHSRKHEGFAHSLQNGTTEDAKSISVDLVKKLYGVPSERGGTTWLDECPDYIRKPVYSPEHAIIVRYKEARQASTRKALNLCSIDIQSPALKDAIREVFQRYPGESVDLEEPSFDAPFHPFFHQWPTLLAAHEASKQESSGVHHELSALVTVLHDEFGGAMKDTQSLASNGNTTFDLVWTLFPPGCPVFGLWQDKEHCFLVNEAKYHMADAVPTFAVELLLLDHGNDSYGWRKITRFVTAFAGSTRITDLPVVPLPFLPHLSDRLRKLHIRGSSAADLLANTPVYRAYDGPIRLHKSMDLEDVQIFVDGRILVEPRMHAQQASRYSPWVSTVPHKLEALLVRDPHTKLVQSPTEQEEPMLLSTLENLNEHPVLSIGFNKLRIYDHNTEAHAPLQHHQWTQQVLGIPPEAFCSSVVRGYCLTSKSWAEFEVDTISDIRWNEHAFDSLVIPPVRKRILEALVRQQQGHKTDADLDDVVFGKGQGLIILLAGPPGTGKTLTAESIADRLQLPLYSMSASELGDTATAIEEHFGHVLRLAASWNAVLLLDEADAFLEKRIDSHDARERNKRVAGKTCKHFAISSKANSHNTAFLRILEYYRGILILTTNRSVNFDDAFYSRIHLSLNFKPLDQNSREQIWTNLLRGAQIDSADIHDFAAEDLNGRQIKNIVKMAKLLAKEDGQTPLARHVRDVLEIVAEDLEPTSNS
jgi:hypothetical protein